MSELNYRYELDQGLVAIENLQETGYSVIIDLDQILAQIETEVGSLMGRHILCQGQDGYWDLLVPVARGEPIIYPLDALTFGNAKVNLRKLVTSGQHMGKIA